LGYFLQLEDLFLKVSNDEVIYCLLKVDIMIAHLSWPFTTIVIPILYISQINFYTSNIYIIMVSQPGSRWRDGDPKREIQNNFVWNQRERVATTVYYEKLWKNRNWI